MAYRPRRRTIGWLRLFRLQPSMATGGAAMATAVAEREPIVADEAERGALDAIEHALRPAADQRGDRWCRTGRERSSRVALRRPSSRRTRASARSGRLHPPCRVGADDPAGGGPRERVAALPDPTSRGGPDPVPPCWDTSTDPPRRRTHLPATPERGAEGDAGRVWPPRHRSSASTTSSASWPMSRC